MKTAKAHYIGTGRGIDRIDPASGRISTTSAPGSPPAPFAAVRAVTARCGLPRPPVSAPVPGPTCQPRHRSSCRPQRRPSQPSPRLANRTHCSSVGENTTQIDFVALGFSHGEELRYQYRLEGADDAWSKPSTQRTVNYASLASGSYRFLVRAVNSDAMVSDTPASLTFTVLPPIWWRWWFITLVALAVAACAYMLHRVRVARLMEVVQMRTGIATDLHDDIGANLTRIAILSEVARRQQPLGDADRPVDQSLSSIARIARESVAGMSDIVWAISPDRDNLGDLVRKMREHVEEVFAVRNLGVLFNPPAAGLPLKLDSSLRRDFYLIFKEAVNNAARHSGCSKIAVDFRADRAHLCLAVTDDGSGFDVASESDGHGLVSMRQRAKRLGTTLEVDSRVGHGTTITLTIVIEAGSSGRRSTGKERAGE